MNFEQARFNMIEQQIRPWDVLDQRVLDVMTALPREHFVPEKHQRFAFSDIHLPLNHGQVMMKPTQEGRLLQSLVIHDQDEILEIGTGSAYLTACLAKLSKHVYSLDLHDDFIRSAAVKLKDHDINNITLITADATQNLGPKSQYDVIVLTGSVPEIPEPIKLALKNGGRLFAVVGRSDQPIMEARLIRCIQKHQWREESLFETSLPPLQHIAETHTFEF